MMTILEYLSNHSKNRQLDKTIIIWYRKIYGEKYEQRSKEEWDKIIDLFMGETEKNPVTVEDFKKIKPQQKNQKSAVFEIETEEK